MSDLEKLSAELAAANINYDNLLADHVIVEREYHKLRAEVASMSEQFQQYAREMESDMNALAAENERLLKEARFNDISVLPEKDAEYASLRAENEKLRAALEEIAKPGGADGFWECVEIANAALKTGETSA